MKTLESLPKFTIQKISSDGDYYLLEGPFNHFEGIVFERGWLYIEESWQDSLSVRPKEMNKKTGTAILALEDDFNEKLQVGSIFPYLDGSWNPEDIALVLDSKNTWSKVMFQSSDADVYKTDGYTILGPVGQKPDKDAEYIGVKKNGWDHEHCHFCYATISEHDNKYGYVNEKNTWVCEECYTKYIVSHDLSFMDL